jgi:UDP-3-O-[3-hydroxymyristoyl] N-acetylglucosamine deacetylase/3-hydroxyacyl-[acyl-carrier-protein] dehydratase
VYLILSQVEDPENYNTYFMKIDNAKFKEKVLPGDTLVFRLDLMGPYPQRSMCHERHCICRRQNGM